MQQKTKQKAYSQCKERQESINVSDFLFYAKVSHAHIHTHTGMQIHTYMCMCETPLLSECTLSFTRCHALQLVTN